MTQYIDYGSIPQAVRELVASKISLLDQYILVQTGAQEYTALINKPGLGCQQIRIYRTGNYGGVYQVDVSSGTWSYTVSNEYYAYSNVGYGTQLDLPVTEAVTSWASVILACALILAIFFKGVLFPWKK